MQNLLLQKKIIYDSTLLNIDLSFLTLSYFMISFLNMQYQQQKKGTNFCLHLNAFSKPMTTKQTYIYIGYVLISPLWMR